MRKLASHWLAVLMVTQVVTVSAHALSVGVHAGLNSLGFSGTGSASDVASRGRFMFGGFLETSLNPIMNLQIEANYLKAGDSTSIGSTNYTGPAYLSVPVFVQAKIGLGLPVKPFFMVGPNLLWKLSGDTVGSTEYKSIAFALDFGGGVEVSIAPMLSLVASARYSMGLTDLQGSTSGSSLAANYRIKSIQVLGGVSFGF